jgi:hypothetical protein
MSSTKKATTAAAVKKLTKTKQKKKGRRTYRNPWRRSPSERATEDALYLRELVPVMRELGVCWFADIELVPVLAGSNSTGLYRAECGPHGVRGTMRSCVLSYGHKGMHVDEMGSAFDEDKS